MKIPLIKTSFSGISGFSVLDTGTSPSAIDIAFYKQVLCLNLPISCQRGEGIGDSIIECYEIGDMPVCVNGFLENVNFLATDLGFISKALEIEVQSILGESFLANKTFMAVNNEINFLSNFPCDNFLIFYFINNTPAIEVRLNDCLLTAIIDTGNNSELSITESGLKKIDLANYEKTIVESLGYGGTTKSLKYKGRFILELHDETMALNEVSCYGSFHGNICYDVNIGYGLIKKIGMIMDYKTKRLKFHIK
jgi:hypothetical protein